MSSLTLRLPKSTHEQLKTLAKQEEVSINQLVLTAVAEKISSLRSARLYGGTAGRTVTRADFEIALSEVPDVEPDPWETWKTGADRDV